MSIFFPNCNNGHLKSLLALCFALLLLLMNMHVWMLHLWPPVSLVASSIFEEFCALAAGIAYFKFIKKVALVLSDGTFAPPQGKLGKLN